VADSPRPNRKQLRRSRDTTAEAAGFSTLRPPRAASSTPSSSETPVTFWSFIGHQLLIGVDETVTAEMEDESARKRRKGVYHFLQVRRPPR
jgi:hypothetical protein